MIWRGLPRWYPLSRLIACPVFLSLLLVHCWVCRMRYTAVPALRHIDKLPWYWVRPFSCPRLSCCLPRCCSCHSPTVPAAHRRHHAGLADFRREGRRYEFEYTIRAAAVLAGDMGLFEGKIILERTLTRGYFIRRRYGSPVVILGVCTDKLPRPSPRPDRPWS